MKRRAALSLLAFALAARADAVLLANGKTIGIPEGVEVTPETFRSVIAESTGTITFEGYSYIEINKRKVPVAEVRDYAFKEYPESLTAGFDLTDQGQFADAIDAFQSVLKDGEVPAVYKTMANYELGRCYVARGDLQTAEKHFSQWSETGSRYTPYVLSIRGDIQKLSKNFAAARATFDSIAKLPEIPKSWVFLARLGGVGVDIEERKFPEAEGAARAIFNEAKADPKMADAQALSQTLVARSILLSEKKERLPEAQAALEQAQAVPGAGPSVRAQVFSALGDVVYAQGNPEVAREHYMRVVLLFPDSESAPHALYNAGQCFVDLFKREEGKNADKANYYLTKGGDLLLEYLSRHRGKPDTEECRRTFAEIKKKYEELKKAG